MDGEDQGASGGDPTDDWADDAEAERLRGWISPDDRLWRHPSETGPLISGAQTRPGGPPETTTRIRTGPWIVGGATACLVLALLAAGLVMTTNDGTSSADGAPGAGSLVGSPTTEPGVHQAARVSAIPAMVSSIRQSTVALVVDRSGVDSDAMGLVAEAGGFIATSSDAVSGARSITVIEPDGSRHVAGLVGVDRTSGIAVLQIDDDLPVATFDQSGDLATGTVALAMSLEPGRASGAVPSPEVYAGTVLSSGEAVGLDPVTTNFAATEIAADLSTGDLGCPLLDGKGAVVGMLETTSQRGSAPVSVFLPAELVVGVTRQLVSSGSVDEGWLGVGTGNATAPTASPVGTITTASTPIGVVLDSVDDGSPAADAGLEAGDVIDAVNGEAVHSPAELRARLYVEPPDATVQITLVSGGSILTRSATLADDDAPGDGSSP